MTIDLTLCDWKERIVTLNEDQQTELCIRIQTISDIYKAKLIDAKKALYLVDHYIRKYEI